MKNANQIADDAKVVLDGTLRVNADETLGSVESSGYIAFNNGSRLTLGGAEDFTFAGQIGGTGAITKLGTGTLTLTGASNPDGESVVEQGTLVVDGNFDVATVKVHGTLGGDGTLGAVVLEGGVLSPAMASRGHDSVRVTESVKLGAASLEIELAMPPQIGDVFRIVNNTGNVAIEGSFAGLEEGAAIVVDGHRLVVSYQGGDGNDVTLTVSPEPPVETQNPEQPGSPSPTTPEPTTPASPDPSSPEPTQPMGTEPTAESGCSMAAGPAASSSFLYGLGLAVLALVRRRKG